MKNVPVKRVSSNHVNGGIKLYLHTDTENEGIGLKIRYSDLANLVSKNICELKHVVGEISLEQKPCVITCYKNMIMVKDISETIKCYNLSPEAAGKLESIIVSEQMRMYINSIKLIEEF